MTLPLPSIEILAEAASSPNRRGSVLHVLETTVIGWIKQIKVSHLDCSCLDLCNNNINSVDAHDFTQT